MAGAGCDGTEQDRAAIGDHVRRLRPAAAGYGSAGRSRRAVRLSQPLTTAHPLSHYSVGAMLAVDVPLWFAAIGLVVPAATALLTLIITGRQNSARMTYEAAEHDKDRAHSIHIEVRRELRAERKSLYVMLVNTAKAALWIDQPMADSLRKTFAKLEREQQSLPAEEPLENDFFAFDSWRRVLTEVEIVGSAAVKEAARAVGIRIQDKLTRDADRLAREAETGRPWQHDATIEDEYARASRELIQALGEACSDDLAERDTPTAL